MSQIVFTAVYQLLAQHDIQKAVRFHLLFKEQDQIDVERQIVLMNRFWRDELAGLPISTLEVRRFLIDASTLNQWLALFTKSVLPTILAHW